MRCASNPTVKSRGSRCCGIDIGIGIGACCLACVDCCCCCMYCGC